MNELALFAGCGGGLLATKWLLGFKTVCYVENNPYRVRVLKARIRDGLLDDAPIWGDVKTFDGTPWRGCVDIVTAGFPCQPFSVAGKQQGQDDERNLWPETIRVIREARPAVAFLENVPGLVSSGYIFTVLNDLAQSGYEAFPPVRLTASDVGANHKRERIWIVAYANSGTRDYREITQEASYNQVGGTQKPLGRCSCDVAHAPRQPRDGSEDHRRGQSRPLSQFGDGAEETRSVRGWWVLEPSLDRVVDGCTNRVERVTALGDMQVSAVVAVVWGLLTEA